MLSQIVGLNTGGGDKYGACFQIRKLVVTCHSVISLTAVLTLHVSAQVGLLGETPLTVPALVQSEVVVAG